MKVESFEDKVRAIAKRRREGATLDELIKELRQTETLDRSFYIAENAERLNEGGEVIVELVRRCIKL